ncbi:MAG: thioredoxin family protein [Syntrophomonadaceae bacterium]|nr:thioredoxin family protein [Syntrophomonadaceae bacterium]MDD3022559.1 thioredoxin family protein [Syntrophomonadaceae bacterium]
MKKGYIIALTGLLIIGALWGFSNYNKPAPLPPEQQTALDSDAPGKTGAIDNTTAEKQNADEKQVTDKSNAAKQEPANSVPGVEKQAPALSDTTDKQQTPLSAAATIEQTKANGESMWLLFRSQTCAPCVEMKKVFDQLQLEYQGKVRFIAIDVDEPDNQELAEEWKIQYIPSTFILNSEGKLSYKNIGLFPVEDLKKELDRVVK